MKKIASFTVNHLLLKPGLYVSRRDVFDQVVLTTFDLRITHPNREPVMNTGEIHAIEHLGATFLRNHKQYQSDIVYFGPMGCRTGFYLIMRGDLSAKDMLPLITKTFRFIAAYDGKIPGASPKDCGHYLDMDLPMARFYAQKYLSVLERADESCLTYPGGTK